MRTLALAVLFLGLASSPAWALPGGHGGGGGKPTKYAYLTIVNQCDGAVAVSLNGAYWVTLEPGLSANASLTVSNGNRVDVTVGANLVGTSVSTTASARLTAGKSATATITAPTPATLAITYSGEGLARADLRRESGVVLASSGGLLPLIWIGVLLGRRPRHRKLSGGAPASANDDPASMLI